LEEDESLKTDNSTQSVPELGRDLRPNKVDEKLGENNFLVHKNSKLKQTLIKQASLTNPPSYLNKLNSDRDDVDQNNEALYENSSQTKSFTSNQELLIRKIGSTTSNNSNFYSSPNSSNSQLNLGKCP
jgi:hypothetical protein